MPRVTRAALRLNARSEETDLAASTPLPLTPLTHRAPLGEITGNSEEVQAMIIDIEPIVKVPKKASSEGRPRKIPKKEKTSALMVKSEESVEVIEDDNQSATSSAVDEACQELMKEPTGEIHQVVVHDQRPRTPPSPAVIALKKHLSNTVRKSNADLPSTSSATTAACSLQKSENKPARAIITVTAELPSEGMDRQQGCEGQKHDLEENDTMLEQTMTGSPVQPITRIEDSVEAIDAFEEAIEKVGNLIPAIAEGPRTLTKATKAGDAPREFNNEHAASLNTEPKRATKAARSSIVKSRRPTTRATSAFHRLTTSHLSPPPLASPNVEGSELGLASPADSVSLATDAAKSRVNTKRISSIYKAPFRPAKSAKPPTRSNFELPGEAVARKLKEQREERLKRGGEEAAKKPAFKARLVPTTKAPVVRQTVTSSARLSLAKTDFAQARPLQERASVNNSVSRPGSISIADARKRLSTHSQVKQPRPSLPSTSTARPVRPRSSLLINTQPTKSVAGPSRDSLAASDWVPVKLRGKDALNRHRVELEERERLRKEREEAARKARAEAAERGRIASREWAEKQRIKKSAVVKENSEEQEMVK